MADVSDHCDAPDDALGELFWAVARRLRNQSKETLEPWGITPSHARALAALLASGPIRLSELSELLRIAPRSATEVVDGLEQHGYVARRPDPSDRRATLVALTDEGQRAGAAIRTARAAETARFFGELSATDRTRLAQILRKLNV